MGGEKGETNRDRGCGTWGRWGVGLRRLVGLGGVRFRLVVDGCQVLPGEGVSRPASAGGKGWLWRSS